MNLCGTTLAHAYELREFVRKGGYGDVYFARDTVRDRDVAVKVLQQRYAADPAAARRFREEGKLAIRLRDPEGHIVEVYDALKADGHSFIVMEFVRGTSLHDELERRRPGGFGHCEALDILGQTCKGLARAQQDYRLVHRDVKPANILLERRGAAFHVKIIDFGTAKQVPADLAGGPPRAPTLEVVGTPSYIAPERLRVQSACRGQEPLDFRGDVYSLGVILHEMLTSELPTGIVVAPGEEAPQDVPEGVWALMRRCLEFDPMRRFSGASELRDAIDALLATSAFRGPEHEPEVRCQVDTQRTTLLLPAADLRRQTRPDLPIPIGEHGEEDASRTAIRESPVVDASSAPLTAPIIDAESTDSGAQSRETVLAPIVLGCLCVLLFVSMCTMGAAIVALTR